MGRFLGRIISFLIAIALIFAGISIFLDYQNYSCGITSYQVETAKLKENHHFIFLSDLHVTEENKLFDQVIEKCRSNAPEAIFITGDLIDANVLNIEAMLKYAKELGEIARVYWVTGNHEAAIIGEQLNELKKGLAKCNFVFLDNKTELLKLGDDYIQITGVEDPLMRTETDMAYSELKRHEDSEYYSILLNHRAENMNRLMEHNFNLCLTGHAHGGQVVLPFVGPLYSPGEGALPKYTEGIWEVGESSIIKRENNDKDRYGIINRGIGASRFKYRVFNMPEIIAIDIVSKANK